MQYRDTSKKFNVSFSADNSKVEFDTWANGVFVPELSIDEATSRQLTSNDQITTVNVVWDAILSRASGQLDNFFLQASGATMIAIFQLVADGASKNSIAPATIKTLNSSVHCSSDLMEKESLISSSTGFSPMSGPSRSALESRSTPFSHRHSLSGTISIMPVG